MTVSDDILHRHQKAFDRPDRNGNPVSADALAEKIDGADPEKMEMPWGKFKGLKIMMLKDWYLKWLVEKVDNPVIVEAAKRELRYRQEHP